MMIGTREVHRLISKRCLLFISKYWFLDAERTCPRKRTLLSEDDAGEVVPGSKGRTMHRRLPAWPALFLGLYIYATIKMTVYSYFQYNYDIEYLRLCQLNQTGDPFLRLVRSDKKIALNSTVYLNQKAKTESSRAILKSIGAPFSELHLVSVGAGLLMICIPFALYGNYLLLTSLNLIEPFDLYFLRIMLNEQADMEYCRNVVQNVVNRFKTSSQNQISELATQMNMTVKRYIGERYSVRRSMNDPVSEKHKLHAYLSRQADLMMESGQLEPINRSPEWVDRKSFWFALSAAGKTIYSLYFDGIIIFALPYLAGYLELSSSVDAWLLVDVLILATYTVIATNFFVSMLGVTCLDQKQYLARLSERLRNCIKESGEIFATYEMNRSTSKQQGRMEVVRIREALNRNLMRALLEFEIFAKQFEPTRRSFPFVINTITIGIFIMNVVIRFYMPYLSPSIDTLVVYYSMFTVFSADLIFIPICQIHQLGMDLHQILWSMMAQTVELNSSMINSKKRHLFSAHLYWKQRKLLADPNQFMSRFKAHGFNGAFEMSWLGLMKLHIVYSILLVSTFIQTQSWRTLAGDRIDDPLGLFVIDY